MTGLRIRWRKGSSTLTTATPTTPAVAFALSSGLIWVAVAFVLLLAFLARSYDVNWDSGTHLHPDERHMTGVATSIELPSDPIGYFDTGHSKLNPYNPPSNTPSFVYGT